MISSISTSRKLAWAVWIVGSIFYAYQYILRVMPSIMIQDIMDQFGIGALTFGQFSGVYYLGYSLIHLPIGIMLDRFGPKKVMTGCILLTVAGLMPLLFAEHWIYPIAGRFLIGIGSSAAILGVFKIIRMSFTERQFPRMLSFSVVIGLIGAIYGGVPVSAMRESLGYDAVIQLMALAGVVLAAITYLVVPDIKAAPTQSAIADIKQVLSNKKVILTCLFAGLMVGPIEGFSDVWATVFLKQVYGFEGAIAAGMPSMIFMGMCIGAPILNLIAEKCGYLLTIISAGIVMSVCFFFLLSTHIDATLLGLNFGLVGVASAYQILAIYKASTYVKEEVAGLTTALANMIIMIFGYGFHTAIGGIVNHMGGTQESEALIYGVSVVPIALVLGTVGFIVLLRSEKSPALEPSKI
jgi:predicted MFS family arabinose efflux permease